MESRDVFRLAIAAAVALACMRLLRGARDFAWGVFGVAWVLYWSAGWIPFG